MLFNHNEEMTPMCHEACPEVSLVRFLTKICGQHVGHVTRPVTFYTFIDSRLEIGIPKVADLPLSVHSFITRMS